MLPQQTVLSDDSENQYNALADNADVIEEEEDADDDSVISQIELGKHNMNRGYARVISRLPVF